MTTVAVLGRGIAGAAAAWAASRAGASVLSFGGPPLASSLTSGAADDEPWELGLPARELDVSIAELFADLGGWTFPASRSAVVATSAGVLRPARGHDAQVLDLASLPSGVVAVPRLARPNWDADELAASWNAEALARTSGLRFEAVDADLLHHADETHLPEVDWAARLSEPKRHARLAARLTALAETNRFVALLGPSGLGSSGSTKLPTGEILSGPGGPAGARLAAALGRLLPPAAGALARVTEGADARLAVEELAVAAGVSAQRVDAVVLAVGGVLAGGIAYRRTEPAAVLSPIPQFHAPSWPRALVGQHGDHAAIELPLGEIRWSRAGGGPLERVGVLHEESSVRREEGGVFARLYVAGDAAAGRPRTLLTTVRDGLRAGTLAATSPDRA